MQMRRILIAPVFLGIAGIAFIYLSSKILRYNLSTILQDHWAKRLVITGIVMTMLVVSTFQVRLSDSFRHAYASGFLAYYTTPIIAEKLGNLVEWVTSFKKNELFNSGMDECNNRSGREIALKIKQENGPWHDVEKAIELAHKTDVLIKSKRLQTDILNCFTTHFPNKIDKIEKMTAFTKHN